MNRSSRTRLTATSALLLFLTSLVMLGQTANPDIGTPDQQAGVRTGHDVSTLPLQSACTVVPAKELFITNTAVVDDPCRTGFTAGACTNLPAPATQGAWTLAGLLPGVFGTTDPATLSTLTLDWLHNWLVDGSINGDNVPTRSFMKTSVIDPWLAASGNTGQLDLKKAPFLLEAVVARLDLRQSAPKHTGGELRFVFNLRDLTQPGSPGTPFNLILEYGLDAANCQDILNWSQSFHALGSVAFGNTYNADLETLTDRVTALGASPAKPNGSAIDQIRTNEIFLTLTDPKFPVPLWELREFHTVDANTGHGLIESTVALTPAISHNDTQSFADFVIDNTAAINSGNFTLPLTFDSAPFRGGHAPHAANAQGQPNVVWDGPAPACSAFSTAAEKSARGGAALNTCQGCHGKETAILDFVQVKTRNPGAASQLSVFLNGGSTGTDTVTDACGLQHKFNDLNRRRVDLCQELAKSCAQIDAEPAVAFTE
jgi:hypothetical protein